MASASSEVTQSTPVRPESWRRTAVEMAMRAKGPKRGAAHVASSRRERGTEWPHKAARRERRPCAPGPKDPREETEKMTRRRRGCPGAGGGATCAS